MSAANDHGRRSTRPRRKRCGSTVISTPFGAIAVLPTVDREAARRDVRDRGSLRSAPRGPATAPNESSAGSATSSCCTAARRSTRPGARRGRVEVGALRGSDEQPVEAAGAERRPSLREHRCDAGGHGRGGARPADRPEPHLAVVAAPRLGRRHGDARRGEVGLERAVENEPARRERRDRPHRRRDSRPRRCRWRPSRECPRRASRGSRPTTPSSRPTTGTPAGTSRLKAPAGSGPSTSTDSAPAEVASSTVSSESAARGRSTAFPATALTPSSEKSPAMPLRGRPAVDEHDVGGHGVGRRAAERDVVLVEDAEAGAHVHANRRRCEAAVRGADGHGVGRAARAGDAPVGRPRPPVVAGRDDRRACRDPPPRRSRGAAARPRTRRTARPSR